MSARTSVIPVSYRQRNQSLRDSRRGQWMRFELRRGTMILAMALASWGIVTGLGWSVWVIVGTVLGGL